MKKFIIVVLMILIIGTAAWQFYIRPVNNDENAYLFVEAKRGKVESLVSSTGTVEAVNKIDVGTQVSGIIQQIYVDFNDRVSEGQLIAVLDTVILVSRVKESQATLLRARVQFNQAEAEYKRNQPLFEKGFLSEEEYIPIQTNLEINRSSLQIAQINLERSKTNLKYAKILSPMDGVIIQRSIEPGQTVASSFSAPTLFIITDNLSQMEILATVDESDIGQIKEGQEVIFTVPAYPDVTFNGTVRQVRLQPTLIQNVVNYTVVVVVSNESGMLLPGMTATVDFIVERVENVLVVPNAAIRFEPPVEMLAELMRNMQNHSREGPDSTMQRMRGGQGNQHQSGFGGGFMGMGERDTQNDTARLWYLDENGRIGMKRVRIGVTDGLVTEIKMSQDIVEGMQFISGITQINNNLPSSNAPPGTGRRFGRGLF